MFALYSLSIVGTLAAYVYFCLRFVNVLEDELLTRHPWAKDRWKIKMIALHFCIISYWVGLAVVLVLTWDHYPYQLRVESLFR